MSDKFYPELYFTTASIYQKHHLLRNGFCRAKLIEAFEFITIDRAYIYAFVIMSNHFHIIWQLRNEFDLNQIQHSVLSFTSKAYLAFLKENHPHLVMDFSVRKSDRAHQFWQSKPLSIRLSHRKIIQQKMNYIHENPVRANLVKSPGEFTFSSFSSYLENEAKWSFLILL